MLEKYTFLSRSDGNRKKLTFGCVRLFFEQFTAEHHIFGPVFFSIDESPDSKLAILINERRSTLNH